MGRLTGKVAIITGSGSGIGRAVARLFAKEGAKVVVVDVNADGGRETVKLIQSEGGEATFLQANVVKSDEVNKMVKQVIEKYGKIDVLHNNVGGWKRHLHDTVTEDTEEEWDWLMDLNLKSIFLVSKEVIPYMIKNGGGSIINTITTNAYMTYEQCAGYSAAKAGAYELTKAMCLDYAKYNIRVNGIVPGETETPQWLATFDTLPNTEEAKEALRKRIPLGRFAQPEDIAFPALWLASDEARYVIGEIIIVDGGLTAGFY